MQLGCIENAERNADGGGGGGGDRGVACNQSSMAIKFSADQRETASICADAGK